MKPFNHFGFTLIELLVVIAVLGILASFGAANYLTSVKKGRDTKRKQDLYEVKKALRLYYNDHQSYPPGSGNIGGGSCEGGTCSWGVSLFGTTTAPYMKKLPQDPLAPAYQYIYNSTGGDDFTLEVCLENRSDPYSVATPGCPSGKKVVVSND